MEEFDTTPDSKHLPKPITEFVYQGPLLFVFGLFLWSLCGHVAIVIGQEQSGILEYLYLFAALVCSMVLNNRVHGINHRIRFFKDYLVVPKLFNPWFWQEEIIFYRDIKEIKCYGDQENHWGQMHLITNGPIYPLLNKKLKGVTLKDLMSELARIAPTVPRTNGSDLANDPAVDGRISPGQKFLMVMAVVISVVTIAVIVSARPYLSVLDATRFFIFAAVCSIVQTSVIAQLSRPSMAEKEKSSDKKEWHRKFLLTYIGLYSMIAWAFGLISINGALDKMPAEKAVVHVVSVDEESGDGPFCFEFAWADGQTPIDIGVDSTRAPASQPGMTEALCRRGPSIARQGEKMVLYKHRGALGAAWISTLAPLPQ